MSDDFFQYCDDNSIPHQMTCPNTPQPNGVAKRKLSYLVSICLSWLHDKNLPRELWEKLFNVHAMYLIGFLLGQVHKYLPLKLYMVRSQMLIIFGCLVPFAMFPKSNRTKLNPKANKSVFVGYDSYRKGWRCMDPDTKKFTNSKDVVFDEVSSLFSTPEIFSLDDDQANLVLLFPTTNA